MCGRFTLTVPPEMLKELFGVDDVASLPARYNIAPTQDVAIVRRSRQTGKKKLDLARWGLAGTAKMINARQETVFEKPPFASAVRARRCLVPADGFFEWRPAADGGKQPIRVRVKDQLVFAMAGIFERWKSPAGEWVETCSVITTKPNELVAPVHDRMPVILAPESWELWLDQSVRDREPLEHLFAPFPAAQMIAEPVSRRVNDVNNDDPSCIEVVSEEVASPPARKSKPKQLGFDFE
jgi:putative SOS response-associated peptidase YedK